MVDKKIILVLIILSIVLLAASFLISNFMSSEEINSINDRGGDTSGNVKLVVHPQSPVVSENG